MPAEMGQKITGLFDQAVQAFSDSMKAGVKVQQDIAKFWMDNLQHGSIPDMQKKSQAIFSDILPVAQQYGEVCCKLMESNYRRGSELLTKAFNADNNGGNLDVQAKTRELWDASLDAMRDNTQAVADSNLRVIQAWSEAIEKECCGSASGRKQHAKN